MKKKENNGNRLSDCVYDVRGWLFAISCIENGKSSIFDPVFFKDILGVDPPKSGDLYVVDIESVIHP